MEYRRLGRYGLKVSEIGLGSWLTYGTVTASETAERCIRRALELGINHFDCANKYGAEPHAAERVLGRALAGERRSSYILTTKVFFPVGPGPNDRGLSRKHIIDQVHQSLQAFGTDYVDILYCHRYDPETPIDETLTALSDLIAQGKILYAGVSEWSPDQLLTAVETARRLGLRPLSASQPVYNMLARRIEDAELPIAEREGIGLVTFSALGQGVLTGKYLSEGLPQGSRAAAPDDISWLIRNRYLNEAQTEQVRALASVAREAGMPLARLALAWVLRQPGICSALTGASRPDQVAENVTASGVKLSEDLLAKIDQITGH